MIEIFKVFGFYLEFCNSKLTLNVRSIMVFLGFLTFGITFLLNVLQGYILIVYLITVIVDITIDYGKINYELGDDTSRLLIVDLAQTVIYTSLVSGVQLIFMAHLFVTKKWKNLWLNLIKIQHEMKLPEKFFKKCRNRCYLALLLLFLVKLLF